MHMSVAKKKILFTSHTANFQKFNRPLMRMLRGKLGSGYQDLNMGDWEVHYASADDEKILDADRSFVVNFARSPLSLSRHMLACRQLKKILSENHYDIIHTHTPVGSVITRLAARKTRRDGTKIIYTSHGFHFYSGASLFNWCLWYPVEKIMAHFTDLLVTINREDYARARRNFKTKVKMIDGVGVDLQKFGGKMTATAKKHLEEELKIKPGDFVIAYVAEFTENKDHATLLRAVSSLLADYGNIKVLLPSVGETLDETKGLARQLQIQKNVEFLGYRNDIEKILQVCDLSVSTSRREGLGMNVLEALAYDLPIIVTDNRGHRDIVNDNQKYLFAVGDHKVLAEKIAAAMSGATDYHLKFPARYSLKNSLLEMRKFYESTAK